jgi:protein associated with RNAse G/E
MYTTYDWDLDYLVIPDVRSFIVVLTGYSYHFKESHYSAQCHSHMLMWIVSRGVVLIFGSLLTVYVT